MHQNIDALKPFYLVRESIENWLSVSHERKIENALSYAIGFHLNEVVVYSLSEYS